MTDRTQAPAFDQATARSRSHWVGAVAPVLLIAGIVVFMWQLLFPANGEPNVFVDLDYYRAALRVAATGQPLFAAMPYPPFAMVAIAPLGWFSAAAGNMVWTAATLVLLLVLVGLMVYKQLESRGESVTLGVWLPRAALAGSLLLLSWPVDSQLTNGQLSIVAIALAFIDLSGVLPRPIRGALVGVAGAIKLTPLIFLPYYVVTGQRRQAAVATTALLACTGLGFILYPSDSVFFWTHVGKNDQFGDPCRTDNLSIKSALCRISPGLETASWLWIALGILVALAALMRAWRAFRDGDELRAALTVGAAATVVAPIAWPHYFIWLPLAAIWLVLSGRRLSVLVGAVVFVVYSLIYMSWVFHLIDAGSVMTGAAVNLLVLVPILIAVLGLPGTQPGERRLERDDS